MEMCHSFLDLDHTDRKVNDGEQSHFSKIHESKTLSTLPILVLPRLDGRDH